MLSRRNIRVKVMQTLYGVESMSHDTRAGEPQKILNKKIEDTQELLSYLVLFLSEVTAYAETYAVRKAQKHLATESDLRVSTKIAGNSVIWEIRENASFVRAINKFKTKYLINQDLVKKVFTRIIEHDTYQEYIDEPARDAKGERTILEFIFENYMITDEDFLSEGEEKFIHFNDDMETAVSLVRTVFSKPATVDFLEMPSGDKMDFARELLETVLNKNEYALELIKPKLQNWEVERIALIDMILLKMGVCEILYFETIPTKVTLNEYIDIAKEYSTEKSGHFVNGILDNIYKDLLAQNKIHKVKFNKTIQD